MNVMGFATRQVIQVAPADSVDKAISLMEEHGIHHLVVAGERGLIGMVSDRDILISTGWMLSAERRALGDSRPVIGPTRVEQIMSQPLQSLSEADTARDAAVLMTRRKISAAPVLREGRLLGMVTETDLAQQLDRSARDDNAADRLLGCAVRDMMRAHVMTVLPNAPITEVIHLFRRYHIHHVPVAADRLLLGIISDRDVRRALGWSSIRDMQAEAAGRMADGLPTKAAEIMRREVVIIAQDAPLREALRLMLEFNIHSLPVVDEQELVGIITRTDFVKAIARQELI
jgi:CBS domain-containing protein